MAFFKWQKAPTKIPPKRTWIEDEMKIIGWCMRNNIKIAISPDWKDDLQRWKVEINIKGKTTEKLGVIGKEKAIACEVIASVTKYD